MSLNKTSNKTMNDLLSDVDEKVLAAHQAGKVKRALALSDTQSKELTILETLRKVEIASDPRIVASKSQAFVAQMVERASAVNSLSATQRESIKRSRLAFQAPKAPKASKDNGQPAVNPTVQ